MFWPLNHTSGGQAEGLCVFGSFLYKPIIKPQQSVQFVTTLLMNMATFQKSVQLIQKTKSNRFDNTHST